MTHLLLWILFVLSLNGAMQKVQCIPPGFCTYKAVVVLQEKGAGRNMGSVEFCQNGDDAAVFLKLDIKGLSPGLHAMHVHETGDLREGCTSAGSHYNPLNTNHGDRTDTIRNRHVGDIGNVIADKDGNVRYMLTDQLLSLCGDFSIIGRTLVIHEKVDDGGKGGTQESLKTGSAGSRIACGVIGTLTKI